MRFMTDDAWIEIEVVYALPDRQTIIALKVPAGTVVERAISISGIAEKHPEIDWNRSGLAIFGVRVLPTTVLHAWDRIEICRPLIADPKQARRRRARKSTG
jgi:putative ubiquitin-RnfH superfamily antitoxin RatB of RatAB toxin-antitoxin module